ncbi:MAG: hypothetical protein K8J08_10860 [Thermoanaerobaculia bacterium]|nr:hypothetical protein [Thermoanaerobaculia bacterium]
MGYPLRWIKAGRLYETTSRSMHSRLLLRPSEELNNMLRGIIARGVRKPSEWPGASALKALLKGVPVVGHWFNRTEAYRAKRRGGKVGPWDHAEEESFELAPLPCWAELSAEERQEKAQALVQDIERETRERFAKEGKSPLGARRIMNQHPHSEPRNTKRSPAPLVHAASPEEWITYKRTWLYYVDCYREAANRLKKGDFTVIFPEGSIPPRLPSFRTHGQPRPAPA